MARLVRVFEDEWDYGYRYAVCQAFHVGRDRGGVKDELLSIIAVTQALYGDNESPVLFHEYLPCYYVYRISQCATQVLFPSSRSTQACLQHPSFQLRIASVTSTRLLCFSGWSSHSRRSFLVPSACIYISRVAQFSVKGEEIP